jgi:DNA excision repair protein ERCC-4
MKNHPFSIIKHVYQVAGGKINRPARDNLVYFFMVGYVIGLLTRLGTQESTVRPGPPDSMTYRSEQTPPDIIVDDRERASGLAQQLKELTPFTIEVRRLKIGDILVRNMILIERKTTQDLISSILNGRLESQLNNLAAQKNLYTMIFLEGSLEPPDLKGFSGDELRTHILGIQLNWKIQVVQSRSLSDTVHWIRLLADLKTNRRRTLDHDYRVRSGLSVPPGRLHRHRLKANSGPMPVQSKALSRIPGLGRIKASRLLGHFGSIHRIKSCRVEDLSEVEGIGPDLARKVLDSLK